METNENLDFEAGDVVRFILSDGVERSGEVRNVERHGNYATLIILDLDGHGRFHRVPSLNNAGRPAAWLA